MLTSFLIACVLCLANCLVDAQVSSPCPQVFQYVQEPNETPGRWYGEIKLECGKPENDLVANIILDGKALGLKISAEKITTQDNIEFTIRNPEIDSESGDVFHVRFYVTYNSSELVVPRLKNIKVNNEAICVLHRNSRSTDKGYCGQSPTTIPGPLITLASVANIQQYPWHTAIYKIGDSLEYICGGSLITREHVLTAAHCAIRSTDSTKPTNPNSLLVYLGLQNRRRIASPSVQDLDVLKITIHPQFSVKNFNNDIAVLQLVSEITMSDYVRPICLWGGNQNIEGQRGSVAGWGFDESLKLSDELKHTKLPVVSDGDCVRSNPEFFGAFTSPKSFCAGWKNGTSACNGDSGGGMVFPVATVGKYTYWQLRGIVSLAALDANTRSCDVRQYVIFTDVAKFVTWVRDIVGAALLDALKPSGDSGTPGKKCGLCGPISQTVSKRSIFHSISKRQTQGDDTCCSRRSTSNAEAMWRAVVARDTVKVKAFLCAGEDPDSKFNDIPNSSNYAVTALAQASYEGNVEIMQLLMDYGADINGVSRQGYSPLMMAMFHPRSEPTELLLSKGAYVNQVNKLGETALTLAIRHKFTNLEKLIRDAGGK